MKQIKILFIIMSVSLGCAAQSNIPTNAKNILTSKKWIIQGVEDYIYKIEFTENEMITYSDGDIIGNDKYYFVKNLSQCGPDKFIESNVGNLNTGKYIVFKNFCLELINISASKLEFKNLKLNTIMSAIPE